MSVTLGEVIDRRRLVVCVGTGGVGKTTLAAAIALGAALRGRRAMVLTIDPARQLARALGLQSLAAGGERIADDVLSQAGLEPRAALSAAMLDEKWAWDGFITRHAPSERVRKSILDNRFYRQLSGSYAGTTEYVALEELCRLNESNRYDLIVLDTPPAAHALDFVRAPDRIERLLDPVIARWFITSLDDDSMRRGSVGIVVRRLMRATGSDVMRAVMSFFASLATLLDAVEKRATATRALLADDQTAFVLVAAAQDHVLAGTQVLARELAALGMRLDGAIVNRVLPAEAVHDLAPEVLAPLLSRFAAAGASADVLLHVRRCQREARARLLSEARQASRLRASLPAGVPLAAVPERVLDAHSLSDLAAMADAIWTRSERAAPPDAPRNSAP